MEREVTERLQEQLQRLAADEQSHSPPMQSPSPSAASPGVSADQALPLAVSGHAGLSVQDQSNSATANRNFQYYRPMMERIFADAGVPESLLSIGLVESRYNPMAISAKGAVGIWQFMPATAARFGLSVGQRDERTDPLKSTVAAARYLRSLYGTFGDWTLAVAAYNAGENAVSAALRKLGSGDFWDLASRGLLSRETRAYVPAVIAAQSQLTAETSPAGGSASSAGSGGQRVYASIRLEQSESGDALNPSNQSQQQ